MKAGTVHCPAPSPMFNEFVPKFKALADEQRLRILHALCRRGKTPVCDPAELLDMQQSKLSYHLKILLDADLIDKETIGTWNCYYLNEEAIGQLLSEKLCCVFRTSRTTGADGC